MKNIYETIPGPSPTKRGWFSHLPLWAQGLAVGSLSLGLAVGLSACEASENTCAVSASTHAFSLNSAKSLEDEINGIPGIEQGSCHTTVDTLVTRQRDNGKVTLQIPDSVWAS